MNIFLLNWDRCKNLDINLYTYIIYYWINWSIYV